MRAIDRTRPLPSDFLPEALTPTEREERVRLYANRAAAALRQLGRRRWPCDQSLLFQTQAEAALRDVSLFSR